MPVEENQISGIRGRTADDTSVPGAATAAGVGARGDSVAAEATRSFDLAFLQKRQLARLRARRNAMTGDFGRVLWGELSRKFPALTANQEIGPDTLAECYRQAPVEHVRALFFALKKSCAETPRLTDAESDLLAELLVHAAMRAIDLSLWCAPDVWRSQESGSAARVSAVRTRHSLLAAVGFAGLHGLTFRLGAGAAPDGVIDLTNSVLWTNTSAGLLCTLYDEVFKDRLPRPDRLEPLSADQLSDLKYHFDELRYDDKVVAIYVRIDVLDSVMLEAVMTDVATKIDSHVVLGNGQNESCLTLPRTSLNAEDLLKHVNTLLPSTKPMGDCVSTTCADSRFSSAATSQAGEGRVATATLPGFQYQYDLFISHASEDKADYVDQLVYALLAAGMKVWYDKNELTLGDSISASINKALIESRFALVIFSPHFLAKNWPQAEEQALFSWALQTGQKRLLPVLHGVTVEEVTQKRPLLADLLFCDSRQGMPDVVKQILNAMK